MLNPIAPIKGPGKKTGNTAVSNADGTVTLNDSVTLTDKGKSTLLRKKYEFNKEAPYLGKYGSKYADDNGFEADGGGILDYKDGLVSFKKRYNQDDQHSYIDKVRSLPENKGKEIYLAGSSHPKYKAPNSYTSKIRKTVDPTAVQPIAPIK